MAEPLRTLIVDDEPAAIRRLARLCGAVPTLVVVATAGDGAEALAVLDREPIDLVLLDIEMPGLSGLALAQRLEGRTPPAPPIVFVTAFERFAIAAFAVDAAGYLLKPVDPDLLRATVERLLRRAAPSGPPEAPAPVFWAPHRGALVRLEARDIDYIAGEDDYARLHCGGKSYLVAERLYAIEARLGDAGFLRIHKSTLVNRNRISGLARASVGGWAVRIGEGATLPIGRAFLPALRASLALDS